MYIDDVLPDLKPATLRALAKKLDREADRLRRRARELEERAARWRKVGKVAPPRTYREIECIKREARNLKIVRLAWSGLSDGQIAERVKLARPTVTRIVRAGLKKAALQGPPLPPPADWPEAALQRNEDDAGRTCADAP